MLWQLCSLLVSDDGNIYMHVCAGDQLKFQLQPLGRKEEEEGHRHCKKTTKFQVEPLRSKRQKEKSLRTKPPSNTPSKSGIDTWRHESKAASKKKEPPPSATSKKGENKTFTNYKVTRG